MSASWPRSAAAIIVTCLILSPFKAAAHGDLHERITDLSAEIQRHPEDARLHFKRAELHRLHGDFAEAVRDYDAAALLAPEMMEVQLGRGQLMLTSGRLKEAAECLERFLCANPRNGHAWVVRARIHVKAGQSLAAAEAYRTGTELMTRPEPEHYLEHARALFAAGPEHTDAGIAVLDSGVKRLGQIVTLVLPAIEAEAAREHWESALSRVDAAMTKAPRTESWLERRGDLLVKAGRATEAQQAFRDALSGVRRSRPRARLTKSTRELEQRLLQKINSVAQG